MPSRNSFSGRAACVALFLALAGCSGPLTAALATAEDGVVAADTGVLAEPEKPEAPAPEPDPEPDPDPDGVPVVGPIPESQPKADTIRKIQEAVTIREQAQVQEQIIGESQEHVEGMNEKLAVLIERLRIRRGLPKQEPYVSARQQREEAAEARARDTGLVPEGAAATDPENTQVVLPGVAHPE